MAMYEDKGYCPNNSFFQYELEGNEVSPLWKRTKEILGDRTGYMVYSKGGANCNGCCYIVDALEGAKGTLGIEIACALKFLIPTCKYAEFGRAIICTDLINPCLIPAEICRVNSDKWTLCSSEKPEKTILIEDERYLVAIQDNKEEVHIYLYKK